MRKEKAVSWPIEIIYKDKKHSSGQLVRGKMILSISSRLAPRQRDEHIRILTRRLERFYQGARAVLLDLSGPSTISNDQELSAMAKDINRKYYGFKMGEVVFYRQNSRWGSCNYRTGSIHISHRLRNAPVELLHYVLVHELCHLVHPNHGPAFWATVAKACPSYDKRRQQLQSFGLFDDHRAVEDDA